MEIAKCTRPCDKGCRAHCGDRCMNAFQCEAKPDTEPSACGDDRPNAGCDETCPPCPHRPEPSAEELSNDIFEIFQINTSRRYRPDSGIKQTITGLIEADRAHQREKGRQGGYMAGFVDGRTQASERYADLVEAAREKVKLCGVVYQCPVCETCSNRAICKALSALDEGKGGK